MKGLAGGKWRKSSPGLFQDHDQRFSLHRSDRRLRRLHLVHRQELSERLQLHLRLGPQLQGLLGHHPSSYGPNLVPSNAFELILCSILRIG